jgi:parallel beta-helix repeat protein
LAEPANCAGDGTTDDADCISSYFERSSVVELVAGATYRVTRPVVVHAGREVDGHGATILGEGPLLSVLVIDGSDIRVDSIRIVTHAASNHAVAINIAARAKHVSVTHSRFEGPTSVAALNINAPDVEDVTFDDNTVSDGIYGVLTNWQAMRLRHVQIAHNQMFALSGDGIEINFPVLVPPHGTGDAMDAPSDIHIFSNTINAPGSQSISAGFCIGIAGAHNVEIRDNTLSQCRWQGIHIEDTAADILIAQNTIADVIGQQPADGKNWAGFRDGILALNSRRITVRGNILSDIPDTGIDFTFDGKTFDAGNTVCGNTLRRIGHFGISVMAAPGQDVATTIGPAASCPANTIDAGEKSFRTNHPVGLMMGNR